MKKDHKYTKEQLQAIAKNAHEIGKKLAIGFCKYKDLKNFKRAFRYVRLTHHFEWPLIKASFTMKVDMMRSANHK